MANPGKYLIQSLGNFLTSESCASEQGNTTLCSEQRMVYSARFDFRGDIPVVSYACAAAIRKQDLQIMGGA
jgi:hypothetical protein